MYKDCKAINKFKNLISIVVLFSLLFNMAIIPNVIADDNLPVNQSYQVVYEGGQNSSADGMVSVSKTLQGTDYENIFDITLQVQTKVNLEQLYAAQDTAVVIVMDISYTMKNQLSDGNSRYDAAISSAKSFIEKFQEEAADSNVQCKLGYVAFNTDAHQIVALSDCNTIAQRDTIISTMESGNNNIINASEYSKSPSRFTNIEVGLKMAYDMLDESGIANKYVIFLSDGFPTTYIKSEYTGYNPYMNSSQNSNYSAQIAGGIGSDGYFYNQKTSELCKYGTSYSDKAADRAQTMASIIKEDTKIYAIGVGLGDQQISSYAGYVVDCYGNDYDYGIEGQNYVIGNDTDGFKNWLRNKIASGYYWDSTDTSGLETAYDEIFVDIKETNEESVKNIWLATDPMSATALSNVEFIHFYDINGNRADGNLGNEADLKTENTASVNQIDGIDYIHWDLKNSVCEESGTENSKTYTYNLKYRIRLNTGKTEFEMGKEYDTNGVTFLTYQIEIDGVLSNESRIDFPIPIVKGYTGSLSFNKADTLTHKSLEGVTFVLRHADTCSVCSSVNDLDNISDWVAVSDADGLVYFENIPSGHEYMLIESETLDEYIKSEDTYKVKVAYSVVSSDLNTDVIYNSKILYAQDLIVKKEVKEEIIDGSFVDSDTDDEFEFTINFSNMEAGTTFSSTVGDITTDEDGKASVTFYLKNGNSASFYDVPIEAQYQITEAASAYLSSYSISGNSVVKSEHTNTVMNKDITTEIEKIEVDEDVTVTFINKKFLNKAIFLKKSVNTHGNESILSSIKDNNMYTLEGAQYQIIIDGEVVETLVTDENGEAISSTEFKDGTSGFIKEITAPSGFLLDETEYPFMIDVYNGTVYCEIEVSDTPTFDPTVLQFKKTDAETVMAQGNASFEGAVFKYEYFDNTDWTGSPVKTWYFKTDKNGIHGYHTNYLADSYTSDELYINAENVYMIPLGSVKITEVLAPVGYKVMPVMYATITQSANGADAKWHFTSETLEFLKGSENLYVVEEPIDETKLGSLEIVKINTLTNRVDENTTFAGCEFTIYNKSTNPVKIGDNEITQPGEACMVITVGADGKATSGAVLPVGTYEVKETKGNEFYQCNTAWSYTFTVDGTEDNPVFNTTCENDAVIFTQNITLKKVVSNPDVLFGNEVFTINVEFTGLEANKTYNMSNGNSFTSDASGCATYTARIAHNEEVVFQDIPIGANYKFTEVAGDYKASYSIVDNNKG